MEKIIKKIGNSYIIIFNAEDRKIHKLKVGDIIEFTIHKKGIKKEVKNKE